MERSDPLTPQSPEGKLPPEGILPAEVVPPRAFAQGTGVLLQSVGVMLFLLNCCICSTSFLWDQRLSSLETLDLAQRQGLEVRTLHDPAKLGLMLTVFFSTVGGLAMAACGLGLQSERRHAAGGAMATVLSLSLVLLFGGVELWLGEASLTARLWNGTLLLISLILLIFTAVALRQVIAHPPPKHVEIIPPGTKIPYSFYHDDPPEVRLAKDLAQRRARLESESQELDRMERELREKEKKD